MLRHKYIDRVCCIVLALTLLIGGVFVGAAASGAITEDRAMGYETRLFDQSRVHTIDIVMQDQSLDGGWDAFLDTATSEVYSPCHLVIDGESYKNVGIRGKGNTSLSSVASYGNDRYSFKIEFDQYQTGNSYYGLDKLSLNNLIHDNTYLKDYLSYTFMGMMGVASPLCSFVELRVNGEYWGLYLAVEGVEEGFLQRNYGKDYGELYKPDSMSFGGGRGNGDDFDMGNFMEEFDFSFGENEAGGNASAMPSAPADFDPSEMTGSFGGSSGQRSSTPEPTATATPEPTSTPEPTAAQDMGSNGDSAGESSGDAASSGMPAEGEMPAMPSDGAAPDMGSSGGQSASPAPESTATATPAATDVPAAPGGAMEDGSSGDAASSGMPADGEMPAMPSDGTMPDMGSSGGQSASPAPEAAASSAPAATDMPAAPEGMPDMSSAQPPEGFEMPGNFGGGGFGGFGMGNSDVKLVYSDDDPSSYSNIFNNAKTDVTEADQARLIASLKAMNEGDTSVINTDVVIRYMAVHNFLCNDDSYTGMMVHNYYLYEEDGVLEMIPWDYNLAMGSFTGGTNGTSSVNTSIDRLVSNGSDSDRPMAGWITASEEYTAQYRAAYDEFIATVFESGWFAEEIDRLIEMISPYVEADPTAFCTYDEFQTAAVTVKEFCLRRAQSVRNQLSGTNETVDASDLNLNAMGGMNNGGPGDFGGGDFENRKDRVSNREEGQADMETPPAGEESALPASTGTAPTPSASETPWEEQDDSSGSSSGSQTSATDVPATADASAQPEEAVSTERVRPTDTGNFSMPGMETRHESNNALCWLLVSCGLLLVGLLVTSRFKTNR